MVCRAAGVITSNTFRFNKGQNGGTLWLNAIKKIALDNNVIANGTADKGSGGLEINQCNADVGYCSFLSQKGDKGSAIYAQVWAPPSGLSACSLHAKPSYRCQHAVTMCKA